jgi:hypothetical protein
MSDDKLDRRDAIMAALEQAEEGSLEVPEEKAIEVVQDDISQEAAYEKSRNEKGQFTKEEEPTEYQASEDTEESVETPINRPSTWKKEYVQIWDKLEKGEQVSKQDFTKFAEYANQRESEYKKGVSTYKAEADRAREYENAIAPFVP